MAIPGVFAPINWDDWLLVDGGTLNNIPADVVRSSAPTSSSRSTSVPTSATTRNRQQSLLSLLGKTIDTMMTTSTRRALESADLIIDPDLKGLKSMSWRQSDELAERGYQAAAAIESKLQAYAMSAEAHAAFQAARAAKRRARALDPEHHHLSAARRAAFPARRGRNTARAHADTEYTGAT